MKYTLATVLLLFPILEGISCNHVTSLPALRIEESIDKNDDNMKDSLKITIGEKVFNATLLENATATALKAMLPLTVNMTELNRNEKYFRFSSNLPTNASNPSTINSGDLMLWGSNTLVLFYETFSTSYSYTKIGRIMDTNGLARALGTGNVTVKIELQ
jgi:hypothetical protein